MKKAFGLTFVLLLSGFLNFAQTTKKTVFTRFLEVGVSANAYRGDLAPSYEIWSSAFQLGVKFNKNRKLNSHFALGIGTVRGQNFEYFFSEEATPNVFFKSTFVAVNYDLQYNFLKTKHWIGYLSQGIGFMRFSPKSETGENLQDILTSREVDETYSNVSAIFPTSLGFMYILKNGYGVGTQVSFYNTSTDYLDNISVWGNRLGGDNILAFKFNIIIPLQRSLVPTYTPVEEGPERTH